MAATIPREDCLRTNDTTSHSDGNIHVTKLRPVVIATACMHTCKTSDLICKELWSGFLNPIGEEGSFSIGCYSGPISVRSIICPATTSLQIR